MIDELIYKRIYSKIKEAGKILLVTHERPDVDAISSVCAMIELLEKEGKSYFAYCYNSPPRQYDFLPNVQKITADKEKLNFREFDLIIIFDCGGMNRTKLAEEILSRNKNQFIIEIDHHIKTEDYADLELRNPKASSTTEVVYDFFKTNGVRINKNMAQCILSGILADSGNFLYATTSDKTVKISGEMLTRGANLPQIMDNTLKNKSLKAMKAWGKAMDRVKLNKKYNIAFTILTKDDTEGLEEEEIEGIANFLGNMSEVKAIMVLREEKNGLIKGSLRSAHPTTNVSILAQALGGGGHIKASGFTIEGRFEKTNKGWRVI